MEFGGHAVSYTMGILRIRDRVKSEFTGGLHSACIQYLLCAHAIAIYKSMLLSLNEFGFLSSLKRARRIIYYYAIHSVASGRAIVARLSSINCRYLLLAYHLLCIFYIFRCECLL